LEETPVSGTVAETWFLNTGWVYSTPNGAANGTIVMAANGTFTYTPGPNFQGTEEIIYQVCEGPVCDTHILTIFVTNTPDAPFAGFDSYSVVVNGVLNANVGDNDINTDGGTLTFTVLTGVSNGTLVLNSNGTFTYTPNNNYLGNDSFTYNVCAGPGLCDNATVTITVTESAPPVAGEDFFTTAEDTAISGNVGTNDVEPDGSPLSFILLTSPNNGDLVLNGDGTFTYTPSANFNGTDSFTYSACDPTPICDATTVTITVTPVVDLPVANDDAIQTDQNVTFNGNVTFNDVEGDGDALTVTLVSDVTNGTLTIQADGSFTYVPNTDYLGFDSFEYTLCDADGCDNAIVTIEVQIPNDAPIAVDDTYTTNEDIVLNGNVDDNDSDPNGDTLTFTLNTSTTNGTLIFTVDGTFSYTPNAEFFGTDSFTYTACDYLGECDQATVTITVTQVIDPHTAIDDSLTTLINTAIIANVLANDLNPEGLDLSSFIATGPLHGDITLNANGTLTYTPDANFIGLDSLTYFACNTLGVCPLATVYINVVLPSNPPIAENDVFNIFENTTLTNNVSGNDSDPDGDVLTYSIVNNTVDGTFTLNADGSFTFIPNIDFFGTVVITYEACDPFGVCDQATVSINVYPVNTTPIAVDDNIIVNINEVYNGDVSFNDIETDADAITYEIVTNVTNGTLIFNADGTFTYTPNADFLGTDSFTYSMCDPTELCDEATVFIEVVTVNNDPVATDDNYTINEDEVLTDNVGTNDTDADGDVLTFAVTTNVANGTLQFQGDGSFIYTPNADFSGTDSFSYSVCDPSGVCDNADVFITINAVDDTPNAVDDFIAAEEDDVVSNTVATNDTDAENDALTFALVDGVTNGTLVFNADGSFTYTPNSNYYGSDVFTYSACDNSGCDTATVTIDIAQINDGLIAVDDTYTTNENETLLGNASDNDIDIDGDILTYNLTDSTSNGELLLNEDGSFTYIPNAGFFGTDFFQYEVCDPEFCDTAIVLINVIELNTIPTVVEDSFTMNEDDLLNGDVSTNDFDADGDVLTYSPAGTIETTNGTVILNEDGTFTYTPDPDFFGTDTFEYTACDDNGNCSTVVVTITVLPVDDPLQSAENDQYTVFENDTLNGNVSENDVNLDGFTFIVTSTVSNGTLTFNTDGTFTYVPNAENDGFDEFTYEACDDLGNCFSATVTIIIVAVEGDTVTVAAGFSPNGDNVNETLQIENIEAYPQNKITIFNRWGNVVYEKTGYTNEAGWNGNSDEDGTMGSTKVPEGTYFYALETGASTINPNKASEQLSGFIVIKYSNNQ
jgi:gliding motility-associated-like protein